jgi:hypothetical protein
LCKLEGERRLHPTYDLFIVADGVEEPCQTGLSHAAALRLAHELEREGRGVRVMMRDPSGQHVVDPYPLRR